MFHLEIGVQSTNSKALEAVHRKFDLEQMKQKISRLKTKTNCYLHLDVLGGLPYDSYSDFCKSLDDIASLKPEDIQISLIKILHGTPYEYMAKQGRFYYMSEPPYTILRTDWLNPDEAVMISQISKLFEGIGNTGRFNSSIEFLVRVAFNGSYSKFYENMVMFWRKNKLLFYNFSPENTVKHLKDYAKTLVISKLNYSFFDSLLEHELRLTLKSQNADNYNPPIDFPQNKKSDFKLRQDLRGYWYMLNPISTSPEEAIGNYPIIYSFNRYTDGKPCIKQIDFPLEKAFVTIAIQKKISFDDLSNVWKSLYSDIPIPDFESVIKELLDTNYILYSSHKS